MVTVELHMPHTTSRDGMPKSCHFLCFGRAASHDCHRWACARAVSTLPTGILNDQRLGLQLATGRRTGRGEHRVSRVRPPCWCRFGHKSRSECCGGPESIPNSKISFLNPVCERSGSSSFRMCSVARFGCRSAHVCGWAGGRRDSLGVRQWARLA